MAIVRVREPVPRVTNEPVRSISVVLPAHNEEGNIEAVVRRSLDVLPALVGAFEIIVVDDGSKDRTGEIADRLGAQDQRIRAIHHPKNKGYGRAWQSGIDAAQHEWVFFMDSDRQFDVAELGKLTAVAGGYDIATGYRIHRRDPYYRFLVGSCFNILVKVFFHVHLRDIDCGFKMFRSSLVKAMVLESPGALINTEIHAKANMAGARLVEVGITHYPREVGRQSGTKPAVILSAMAEIVRLRWHLRQYSAKPVVAAMKAEAGR